MNQLSEHERNEKILKMKLQTAITLWGEGRKDATFLILESIDDPRADKLRTQMGFDEYEIVGEKGNSLSPIFIGVGAIILVILSFLLGTVLNLDGQEATSTTEQLTENQIVETIIAPTPQPDEPLSQPLLEMTSTASQIQQTQLAIENNQNTSMSFLDATETARYMQATATEHARETRSARN